MDGLGGANLFDHIKQMMNKIVRVQKRIGPEQAKIIYGNINRFTNHC